MSAVAQAPTIAARTRSGVGAVYRAECVKLSAQLATRLLILACLVGPFAFAVILKIQSGTPSDALFGFWVHSSGFAISIVVMGFAGTWGFPLISGILAGDLFASEDRHGTWKTILTRSATRADTFAGKLLAAATFSAVLLIVTALSSLIAGLALVGGHSLVNLNGVLASPAHVLLVTSVMWLLCIFPLFAYTSLAALISIAGRSGIVGVIGPALISLVTQLLDLIGNGVPLHLLLIGSAFDGWHGLFTTHLFLGPLLISVLVCLIWTAVSVFISWRILRRRDFLSVATSSGPNWKAPAKVIAVAVVVIAVAALATGIGPTGDTRARLQATLTPEFRALTFLQQGEQGHPIPHDATITVLPSCVKPAAASVGPGDWSCTLKVFIIVPGTLPTTVTPVDYDVSVQYNGCFKAQSPPASLGAQTIRGVHGRQVTNPLFIVYGCFNTL